MTPTSPVVPVLAGEGGTGTTAPTVVGIDLSLTCTGIAVASPAGVTLHRITSKGTAGATLYQRWERLDRLASQVAARVMDAWPALVVVEAPAFSRTTGHMHDRSGLWWLVVTQLRYVRIGVGPAVVEVTPAGRCKYATGKGNAPKDAVLAATVRRFPDVDVTDNDTADALILAAMGRDHLGHPLAAMPAAHRVALDAVAWPEIARGVAS